MLFLGEMKRSPSQKKKNRVVNEIYPQFVFRTFGKDNKRFLDDLVEEVMGLLNRNAAQKKRKKNEVIIEALTIGLEHLKHEAKNSKGST